MAIPQWKICVADAESKKIKLDLTDILGANFSWVKRGGCDSFDFTLSYDNPAVDSIATYDWVYLLVKNDDTDLWTTWFTGYITSGRKFSMGKKSRTYTGTGFVGELETKLIAGISGGNQSKGDMSLPKSDIGIHQVLGKVFAGFVKDKTNIVDYDVSGWQNRSIALLEDLTVTNTSVSETMNAMSDQVEPRHSYGMGISWGVDENRVLFSTPVPAEPAHTLQFNDPRIEDLELDWSSSEKYNAIHVVGGELRTGGNLLPNPTFDQVKVTVGDDSDKYEHLPVDRSTDWFRNPGIDGIMYYDALTDTIPELLQNGSFESGLSGWNEYYMAGAYSGRTGQGVLLNNFYAYMGSNYYSRVAQPNIPLKASTSYDIAWWYKNANSNGSSSWYASVTYYNGSGGVIRTDRFPTSGSYSTTERLNWTQQKQTVLTPVGTSTARLGFYLSSNNVYHLMQFDDVTVALTTPVTDLASWGGLHDNNMVYFTGTNTTNFLYSGDNANVKGYFNPGSNKTIYWITTAFWAKGVYYSGLGTQLEVSIGCTGGNGQGDWSVLMYPDCPICGYRPTTFPHFHNEYTIYSNKIVLAWGTNDNNLLRQPVLQWSFPHDNTPDNRYFRYKIRVLTSRPCFLDGFYLGQGRDRTRYAITDGMLAYQMGGEYHGYFLSDNYQAGDQIRETTINVSTVKNPADGKKFATSYFSWNDRVKVGGPLILRDYPYRVAPWDGPIEIRNIPPKDPDGDFESETFPVTESRLSIDNGTWEHTITLGETIPTGWDVLMQAINDTRAETKVVKANS